MTNEKGHRMEKYISIVVPVYNVADYLKQCVQSLVEQNISPDSYEIILVDDGSTDSSGHICNEFNRMYGNIRVFHKKNGGLSQARNFGLEQAAGKYILFVDSDDFIRKNSLGGLIKQCKMQGEPHVFFLQAKKVYADSRITKYDEPMDYKALCQDHEKVIHYIAGRDKYPASAWSKMTDKKFLVDNGIIFKKGQLSEDYEWTLSVLLKAGTFGCYNRTYYYYRQNRTGSITKKVSEKHFSDIINIIEHMEYISKIADNQNLSDDILKIAAFVYRVLLWYSPQYYSKYKNKIKSKKYLLEKKNSKDMKILNASSKIFGLWGTIKLLGLYGRIR